MQPLIKIQTIPIKIEAQTKRASLQHSTDPAPVQKRKPAPVQQRPAPVQQRQRAEVQQQRPTPVDNRANQNRGARQASAQDTSPSYLQEASSALNSYSQSGAVGEFVPAESVSVQTSSAEYSAPDAVMEQPAQSTVPTPAGYSMDRETFDWNANTKPQLEYVPASIEYSIEQYPQVIIEYVGEPIYVPASSNPNYVPPPEAKEKA